MDLLVERGMLYLASLVYRSNAAKSHLNISEKILGQVIEISLRSNSSENLFYKNTVINGKSVWENSFNCSSP